MSIMWVLHDYTLNGTYHLLCFSAAILVARWLANQRHLDFWLCVVGVAEAIFGSLEFFGWNIWSFAEPWALLKPTGTFGQETVLGAFMVACLAPALFYRRWWAIAPISLCIYATGSTMTWAGAGAVLAIWSYSVYSWRAPVAICAGGVAGISLLLHKHGSYTNVPILSPHGRIGFWKYTWEHYILERPLFGFGPGYWYPHAPQVPSPELAGPGLMLTHVHNEFLEGVAEYGFTGALIIGWGLIVFIRKFKPTWHHALVAGVLVDAIGSFPLHIAPIATITLAAWLLCVRKPLLVLSYGCHGGQN